jgi:MFS transporter, ACDE family, multidrug resistance protein
MTQTANPVPRTIFLDPNLYLIFCITMMAVMGVSNLTPAFPRMIVELHIPPSAIGLIITAFTLPGVVLTPVMGILADRWGRKKILVPSLLVFGLAGFLCFWVDDFNLLLLLRVIQGIGGAALGSLNLTLIGDLYRGRERANVMGYNAAVLSIATAGYPLFGGILTLSGWNYPFLMNAAAIPVGILVLFYLKNPEPIQQIDLKEYFHSTFRLINQKNIWLLYSISLVTFIILYGSYLTYFPLYLSANFDASAFIIGLLMSSSSVLNAISSTQVGKLMRRFSERTLIRWAFLCFMLSMLLIPLISGIYIILLPTFLFGLGMGLAMPSIQNLLTGSAPLENRAAFMSVNGMMLRLGQTLGPVLIGLCFIAGGLNAAFFAGAAIAFTVLVLLFKSRF